MDCYTLTELIKRLQEIKKELGKDAKQTEVSLVYEEDCQTVVSDLAHVHLVRKDGCVYVGLCDKWSR